MTDTKQKSQIMTGILTPMQQLQNRVTELEKIVDLLIEAHPRVKGKLVFLDEGEK